MLMRTHSICFVLTVELKKYILTIIKYPTFLAHQIRKSEIFTWDRNSYLNHLILPMVKILKKPNITCDLCIGCIGSYIPGH